MGVTALTSSPAAGLRARLGGLADLLAAERAARRLVETTDDPTAWAALAAACSALGDDDGATDCLLHAGLGGSGDALVELARQAVAGGRLDQGIELAWRASEQGSLVGQGLAAAWTWQADADPDLEDDLREAAPLVAEARRALAELLLADGRVRAAKAELRRGGLAGDATCFVRLGDVLADREHDLTGAIRAYERAIHLGSPTAHHNLGLVLAQLGRHEDAARELELAWHTGCRMAGPRRVGDSGG